MPSLPEPGPQTTGTGVFGREHLRAAEITENKVANDFRGPTQETNWQGMDCSTLCSRQLFDYPTALPRYPGKGTVERLRLLTFYRVSRGILIFNKKSLIMF